MKVKLLRCTAEADELCRAAAAICTNSLNPEKSLQHSLESGHESVLEHVGYTFEIVGVSRVLLAQLTRHRIASFSVESQRYVNQNETDCVIPKTVLGNAAADTIFWDAVETVKRAYKKLLDMGIPQEDARYILPEGMETKLVVTMNARELRHFFSLRCCNRAQWEIREMADRMLDICKKTSPSIFADAGPGCVRWSCPEKKPCGHPRHDMRFDWEG